MYGSFFAGIALFSAISLLLTSLPVGFLTALATFNALTTAFSSFSAAMKFDEIQTNVYHFPSPPMPPRRAAKAAPAENLPPPPPAPDAASAMLSMSPVALLLHGHFDGHQRNPSFLTPVSRTINLRQDVSALPNAGSDAAPEIQDTIKTYVDSALAASKSLQARCDNILSLCVAICTSGHTSDAAYEPFPDLTFLLMHALSRMAAKDDLIRARAVTLFGDTVSSLIAADEAAASNLETINLIQQALFPRLSDKNVGVRGAAVAAAAVLQDAEEPGKCEIVAQLMYMSMHDASPVCRTAAVQALVVTRHTLPTIICRVRDTVAAVRVAALQVLQHNVDTRLMNDLERVVTLRSGLTPRCATTYAAASTTLCSGWMKSLGFNATNLLKLMDVANNESVCELAIKAILNASKTSAIKKLTAPQKKAYESSINKPIDINELTVESSLLLRVRVQSIKEDATIPVNKRADLIEALLPDTPVICGAIQKHLGLHIATVKDANSSQQSSTGSDDDVHDHAFVLLQLLKLLRLADFSEETGRRMTLSLLHALLTSPLTPDELVESCIRALGVAHQSENEYLSRIHDVLQEVSDYDAESSEIDAMDAAFRQLRIVSIVGVVLEHTKRNLEDEKIAQLQDQILPAIMSADDLVREAGITCLGKYAMLGKDAATEYQTVLLSAAANMSEKSEIRAQALLAMSDLAMLYDGMLDETDVLDMDTEENRTVSFTDIIADIIDNGNGGMVVIAAEICAKLLTMGKISNAETLAKLLMIYFDPKFAISVSGTSIDDDNSDGVAASALRQLETDAEDATEVGSPIRLQQMLSLFFPAFCIVGGDHREIMAAAARGVLDLNKKQWTAGKKSTKKGKKALAKKDGVINMDKVLTFISNVSDRHGLVAQEICFFIVEEHDSMDATLTRDVIKTLSALSVEVDEEAEALRDMMGDVECILEEKEANKTTMTAFQKFSKRVETFLEKRFKEKLVAADKASKAAERDARRAGIENTEGDGVSEKMDELAIDDGDGKGGSKDAKTAWGKKAAAKKAPLGENNVAT
jgi:condensin complex subunit 3